MTAGERNGNTMIADEIDFDKLKSYSDMAEATEEQEPEGEKPEPAEEVVEVVENEEPVEDLGSDGQETPASEPEDKAGKGKEKTPPWGKPGVVPKGIQDRFKKLTDKIKQLEAQGQPAPAVPEYDLRDPVQLAQFIATETDRKLAERDLLRKQADEYDRLNKGWTSNMAKAKEVLSDYDDVMAESTVVLPNETLRYMVESEVGPYLSYTIGKDKALQDLINALAPAERHAKVLEVEKTVRAYLGGTKTVAPAPVKKEGVQPPSAAKPPLKAPGSSLTRGATKAKLDPATCDPMDWILNT